MLRRDIARMIESFGFDDCAIGRAAGERQGPGAIVRNFLAGKPLVLSQQVRFSRVVHLFETGRLRASKRLRNRGDTIDTAGTVEMVEPDQPKLASPSFSVRVGPNGIQLRANRRDPATMGELYGRSRP